MHKLLHPFILVLFLTLVLQPSIRAVCRPSGGVVIIDDEYDRYKKRGDDFFKEGRYVEARRQYQNCLEVPGFENDRYAKEQIAECTTGLMLRQQADDAMRQNKGPEAIKLFGQLLNLNPDDAITKAQLGEYYERQGNQLFNQKRYVEAKNGYKEALKFATSTKKESLLIQLQVIEDILFPKPSKRIGLKALTGVIAVGTGAYALLLRSDYQSKLSTLTQINQTADPTGSGIIANPDTYRQYNEAYTAAEAAQQKNGLFKACIGVAALATIAEIYLLVHKPKQRTSALQWKPSSQSWGLAVGYTF
ncbi:tetratricopeptide repeat protein [Spirosoma aerophilum]